MQFVSYMKNTASMSPSSAAIYIVKISLKCPRTGYNSRARMMMVYDH